jgi:sulfur-carrier protein adenylyltransferase/sulfurtransferase
MPPASSPLSPEQLTRYSRQIALGEVGLEGQQKLAASRVLVIGAGGLGSPVALYLAAAGVGTLGIADPDRVELHNLQRQLLHRTADLGRPKVDSAAQTLAALNPHIRLELHPDGITPENARDRFARYDVIVDGSDNFPTRFLAADAAFLAGRPLVSGSILRFEGQVAVFEPGKNGPCFRCLHPELPAPGATPNCAEAGVLGALCGLIGSIQALEVLKLILGIGEPLRGRLLICDALSMEVRTLVLRRDPGCPLCGDAPRIRSIESGSYRADCTPPGTARVEVPSEVDVEEAARLFHDAPQRFLLLDVREPHELAICRIAGAVHLPMRQVSARLHELPRDRRLLVICHHGGRSRQVTQFLRQQGFATATNIEGGIDAWAQRVDPAMARY